LFKEIVMTVTQMSFALLTIVLVTAFVMTNTRGTAVRRPSRDSRKMAKRLRKELENDPNHPQAETLRQAIRKLLG
jgi:biopolymer transport protein ExbD